MKITEKHTIDAPPEIVWPYVADPLLMAGWNGEVVDVQRAATALVTLGERFQMTFRMMNHRDELHDIEVVACEPPKVIEYRHEMAWKGKTIVALARYDLTAVETGVRVVQTMDLAQAGIPWFFRLLFRFIDRFGESDGPTSLETLEKMVRKDLEAHESTSAGRGGA